MSVVSFFTRTNQADKQFENLVRPHMDRLYKVAFRFCGNQHDAEDLIQDVLLHLYSKRDEMAGIEKLQPWLVKVVYHKFIDQTRRDSRSPIAYCDSLDEVLQQKSNSKDLPESQLERENQIQHLMSALGQLSDEHRIVITLYDIEGYSLPEIQTILDIPLGTLKSRLHRARAQLRKHFQRTIV